MSGMSRRIGLISGRCCGSALPGTGGRLQSQAAVAGSVRVLAVPGSQEPDVSIVIVSWRCPDLLRDCLDSLARQDATAEIIVIDNDSGDETVPMLREHYPHVRLVASEENLGFGRANNLGFSMAAGRNVLALNPDTVIPPGALDACLAHLESDPAIGVLSPKLVDREGRLDRRSKRGFPTFWSSICYFTGLDRVLTGRRSREYTAGWLGEDEVGEVVSVSGAFMLMPARVLREVGGFDEQFFMYAEDMDLAIRVADAGYRVLYWPRVSVVHVGAGSNVAGRRPPAADAAYFRTMAPFIRKHRPGVRGRIFAGTVGVVAESMFAASRLAALLGRRGESAA